MYNTLGERVRLFVSVWCSIDPLRTSWRFLKKCTSWRIVSATLPRPSLPRGRGGGGRGRCNTWDDMHVSLFSPVYFNIICHTPYSFEGIVDYLSKVELLVPSYLILAGTKPGEGAVITRSQGNVTDNIMRQVYSFINGDCDIFIWLKFTYVYVYCQKKTSHKIFG